MSYHPRVETDKHCSFVTTRCRNSELWFINNKPLEEKMLLLTAKYTNRYNVSLYALAIEGSHTHQFIHTPDKNRAHFMRDLNSNIAKQVPLLCPEYPGGRLWERRYSSEMVPMHKDDIEEQFFYTVLQPVQAGLVSRLSEYTGYSCFSDAVHGRRRCFK